MMNRIEKIKKYLDLVGIPSINVSAILFIDIDWGVIEELLKILILFATLVLTILRIFYLYKNKKVKDGTG